VWITSNSAVEFLPLAIRDLRSGVDRRPTNGRPEPVDT
jgi:hypothetical protein